MNKDVYHSTRLVLPKLLPIHSLLSAESGGGEEHMSTVVYRSTNVAGTFSNRARYSL